MKKKRIILVIIGFITIYIVIIILFRGINKKEEYKFQDDIIFFKMFDIANEKELTNTKLNKSQYVFNVEYENIKLKNVNISDTVNAKTLVNEKIAPGTRGEFYIILNATKDIKYQVKFESKNTKPKNLKFFYKNINREYYSLEEMEKELIGELNKNEQKTLKISWNWDFEINDSENKQDTIDAQKIRQYNFNIYVIGNELK